MPSLYPRAASALRYPTIPHLSGSAADAGDVVLSEGDSRAFLEGPVRVLEKLDGLNVGLFFTRSLELRFVSRGFGAVAPRRVGPGLWPLVDWAFGRAAELYALLGRRWVLYGEWLAGPSRLPYPHRATDFAAFDLFDRAAARFVPPREAARRLGRAGLFLVPERHAGAVASAAHLRRLAGTSVFGGPSEGVVVERPDGRRAKLVWPGWHGHRVRRPAPAPAPPSRLPPRRGTFSKTFPPDRAEDARREAAVLRALEGRRVAPSLRAVRPRPGGGAALALDRLQGGPWPSDASATLAAALGALLGRLHRAALPPGVTLERLPALPSGHVPQGGPQAAALRGLRRFLVAQERGLPPARPVLCHGDLKPENLLVRGRALALVDFERACLADPAWELACAMDRLELDAPARAALLGAWAGAARDGSLAVRVQLYRLAWRAALPRAVAALEGETGRRPSATAQRLAARARALAWPLLRVFGRAAPAGGD